MNRTLYKHPDGFRIVYSHLSRSLGCCHDEDEFVLDIPIGETGLIDLGLALVSLAFELRSLAPESEAGAEMARLLATLPGGAK